jgi:hypothetical protein
MLTPPIGLCAGCHSLNHLASWQCQIIEDKAANVLVPHIEQAGWLFWFRETS